MDPMTFIMKTYTGKAAMTAKSQATMPTKGQVFLQIRHRIHSVTTTMAISLAASRKNHVFGFVSLCTILDLRSIGSLANEFMQFIGTFLGEFVVAQFLQHFILLRGQVFVPRFEMGPAEIEMRLRVGGVNPQTSFTGRYGRSVLPRL